MSLPIISASRRTDVPAFQAAWFMRRLRAGWCRYPNPIFRRTWHRADLRPEAVSGIVFWTRDARPMLPHLDELDRRGYAYYFHWTLLGYPPAFDGATPPPEATVPALRALAARIGRGRVIWRYDPVILSDATPAAWHLRNVARLARKLAPHVERLVVSAVDPYPPARRRLDAAAAGVVYEPDAYAGVLSGLARIAREAGLEVRSCAEPDLRASGIAPGACVDAALLDRIAGRPPRARAALHRLRPGCLCARSIDIGTNGTCRFGCTYCYAARRAAASDGSG